MLDLKLTEKQVCLSLSTNLTCHFTNAWDKSYDRWFWKAHAWHMCGIKKAKSLQKIILKDLCGIVPSKMPFAICKTTTYTRERSNATFYSLSVVWVKILDDINCLENIILLFAMCKAWIMPQRPHYDVNSFSISF